MLYEHFIHRCYTIGILRLEHLEFLLYLSEISITKQEPSHGPSPFFSLTTLLTNFNFHWL